MKKKLVYLLLPILSICAFGTASAINWDNDNFLDSTFWSQNPSEDEIIKALYGFDGDSTAYTLNWSGYNGQCNGNSVLYVENLPNQLLENTIYVLDTGNAVMNFTIEMTNCSAILSKSGTTFYSDIKLITGINLDNINYAILDNVSMDGASKIDGLTHAKSINGIIMHNSSNNAINNFEAWDWGGAGIYALYASNHNNIQNTKVYNSAYGIRFYSGGNYNVINNVMIFNFSAYGVQLQGSYNSLNNAQIFNGNGHGLSMHQWNDVVYNIINNVQSYNIAQHSLYLGENKNVLLHDVQSFNNKFYGLNSDSEDIGVNYFYGIINSFDNGGDADKLVKFSMGGNEFDYLGWEKGIYNTGETSRDMIVNPKNMNGKYLLDWNEWFPLLQGMKSNFTGKVIEISFGSGVKTQQQPVYRKGEILVTGWNYDENKFIGSDVYKIMGNINLNYSNFDRQNVDLYTTTNIDGVSNYSVYGNISEYKENLDFGEIVNLDLNRIGRNYVVGQIRYGNTIMHNQEIAFVDEYRDLDCPNGWDNNKFLDETFWAKNPTNENIICALYGKDENDTTAYTQIWNSEYHDRCYGMEVVETSTLPVSLVPNTIYLLNSGGVIIDKVIYPHNCDAIISKGGSTIYSSTRLSYRVHFYGIIYNILDNISIDGVNDGKGGSHLKGSDTTCYGSPDYLTVNNVNIISTRGFTTCGSYSLLNNITVFNTERGMNIYNGHHNILSNAQIFNNSDCGLWIDGDPDSTVVNNVQIYNNNGAGLIVDTGINFVFNDVKIYNNGYAMNIQDSSNLKYYGNLEIFGNGNNINCLEKGGNEYSGIGWSEGILKTGEMSWSYITNPRDINGNYMLDWLADYVSLRGMNNDFKGIVSGYSYGSKVANQTQSVWWKGNSLVNGGSYNLENYIGSNTVKITGETLVGDDKIIISTEYSGDILIMGRTGNIVVSELNAIINWPMLSGNIVVIKYGSGKDEHHYDGFTFPECWLEYSPHTETYGNVVVKLVCNNDIIINSGSDTYSFVENGTYIFEFENIFGLSGNIGAKVDWIKESSNGGGSTISKDNCPNGDYSDSYYDGTCGIKPQDSSSQSSSEGQANNELQAAYEFAYENKITTMDTIEKADMEGGLTRIAMAKMLSQYAINVLGKKPANKIVPKFSDITEGLNAEYDYGVSLAYQLGIMGINMPENKFRPFDKVTRAEFGTALSRLIFGIADGEEVYYTTHLAKLKAEGILTNDDPTLQELRGYVMLMLMRSAK